MRAGEEYLQDGDLAGAYSGDDMLALQAADTAVSRMVAQDVSHPITHLGILQ